jgi:hypothetical protein
MHLRYLKYLFLLYLGAGLLLGRFLEALPHLKEFKLYSVIAVVFDTLGIIALSERVLDSAKWRRIIHYYVGINILMFALGGYFGVVVYHHLLGDGPAHVAVGHLLYGPTLFTMVMILMFLSSVADIWETHFGISERTKTFVIGGVFLGSGLLLHFVSAVLDLLE